MPEKLDLGRIVEEDSGTLEVRKTRDFLRIQLRIDEEIVRLITPDNCRSIMDYINNAFKSDPDSIGDYNKLKEVFLEALDKYQSQRGE